MRRPHPVLLFDGECGLCRACVGWLLRRDRRGVLRFASLQSGPGQEFLRAHGLPSADFDTLIFVPNWERRASPVFFVRTDGVLAACAAIGGPVRSVAACIRAVPRGLRDGIYRCVARMRHAVFGRGQPRLRLEEEWARRFLVR